MVLPAAVPPSDDPRDDPRDDPCDDPCDDPRAVLAALLDRVRPVALATEQVLEIGGPLAAVVPTLRRGTILTLAGSGATSVALELLAGAAHGGSWSVVVGLGDLAPVAVHEVGLDPTRVAFVDPGVSGRHVEAIAALIGAVDLVLIDGRLPMRPTDARRLAARARERGSVLMVLTPGTEPVPRSSPWSADLVLSVRAEAWWGADAGHGHLRSRIVEVHLDGRGRASRGARHRLAFPDLDGEVRVLDAEIDATVLSFVR